MHHRLEGLQSIGEIDFQIAENLRVLKQQLGIRSKQTLKNILDFFSSFPQVNTSGHHLALLAPGPDNSFPSSSKTPISSTGASTLKIGYGPPPRRQKDS